MLLDWERFCCGHPAIDLAIILPNLGSADLSAETDLARNYLALWSAVGREGLPDTATLAEQMRLAKVWSVVEFLANAAVNPDPFPQATIDYIVKALPDVLTTIFS